MYNFLIYISYPYGFPIGEPLHNEIISRGHTVKWFIDIEDTKNKFPFNRKDLLNNIEDVIEYKPDIVLAATGVVPDFIRGLKVQIFHGFNAEKRSFRKGHFRIRGFFDLYCTQGPSTTKVFMKQRKRYKTFEVIETGWPKVDSLFKTPKHSDSQKNTILISTTFSKKLSLAFDDHFFEKIKNLSKKGDYRFKMIMHPKLPSDIKQKWGTLENENFEYINTTFLIPTLKECDIMVSDTTSVIQEFLLLKKPVITFNHKETKPYLINITNSDQLENAIHYAFSNPPEIINEIEKYILLLHPYFDGKSSERVIDASIDFLHKDKGYIKKKPLNLIRKWKLRKELGYFTFKSYRKPFTTSKKIEIENSCYSAKNGG